MLFPPAIISLLSTVYWVCFLKLPQLWSQRSALSPLLTCRLSTGALLSFPATLSLGPQCLSFHPDADEWVKWVSNAFEGKEAKMLSGSLTGIWLSWLSAGNRPSYQTPYLGGHSRKRWHLSEHLIQPLPVLNTLLDTRFSFVCIVLFSFENPRRQCYTWYTNVVTRACLDGTDIFKKQNLTACGLHLMAGVLTIALLLSAYIHLWSILILFDATFYYFSKWLGK